jgi:hypothetical protein
VAKHIWYDVKYNRLHEFDSIIHSVILSFHERWPELTYIGIL